MPEYEGTLRWSAYEHEHIERTAEWFWALGIIAACAAITSIVLGNFLFALVILAAAGTIAVIARHPHELHDFEISDKGIQVGETLHSYKEIISFWVETEEEPDKPLLLVDTTKFMSPNLIIPLDGVDPEEVRAYLQQKTKEVHMTEPLAHKILEFFGF